MEFEILSSKHVLDSWGILNSMRILQRPWKGLYRGHKNGLYVVARNLFLLSLTSPARPWLGITGPGKRMVPRLWEFFRQGQAEVVSNSKNKILATCEPFFWPGPVVSKIYGPFWELCTWLGEISSSSCFTLLLGPVWVLLSKIFKPFLGLSVDWIFNPLQRLESTVQQWMKWDAI